MCNNNTTSSEVLKSVRKSIEIDLSRSGLEKREIYGLRPSAGQAYKCLNSMEADFTGWVHYPLTRGQNAVSEAQALAKKIQKQCRVFMVLGVGGSYMGAKAVIDLLGHSHSSPTKVIFAGFNFSGRYIRECLQEVGDEDLCLCVISKSGTTAETSMAHAVMSEYMTKRYGKDEAAARTYVITEIGRNQLYTDSINAGSTLLGLPLDIGGRYSVLTAVGLLPIAVAGIDINRLMAGAAAMESKNFDAESLLDYSIARYLQYKNGKAVEVFAFFDPYLEYFGEWLKQLFGESEGKEGLGLFPTALHFSRDLHSMGQFLQDGSQCFFETFLTADKYVGNLVIPDSADPPAAGKTFNQINRCAQVGVMAAHSKGGTSLISLSVAEIDDYCMGQLIYFFEMSCAVSAMLLGVNPFNQPGVDAYKREMKKETAKLP